MGKWTKVDIIGMKLLEWTAWGFLAFFVGFLCVILIGCMTGWISLY